MYRQPSGPVFCTTGMNQASLAVRKVGFRLATVGRAVAAERIAVDAAAVDVAHVQLFAILGRIGVAVKKRDAAVSRHLMRVVDDRFELPRVRRIRTALAMVVAGFGQMPQMIDHTGADEGAALVVEGDAPGIARPFGKQLELARPRMNAKQRAGEIVSPCLGARRGCN